MYFETLLSHRQLRIYIVFGVAAMVVGIWIYWPHVEAYMTEMLELDSRTRGTGSGGSGRLDTWQHGLEFVFGRSWQLLIGSGCGLQDMIRSASQPRVPTSR